jgi:hypothetical protein
MKKVGLGLVFFFKVWYNICTETFLRRIDATGTARYYRELIQN